MLGKYGAFLSLCLLLPLIGGCDDKAQRAEAFDQELSTLFDDSSESEVFQARFEQALSDPATLSLDLADLASRMRINKFGDVKLYELRIPGFMGMSVSGDGRSSVKHQQEHDEIYIQYPGEDGKVYWLRLAQLEKGYRATEGVRGFYTIREREKTYYVMVTFLYDEEDTKLVGPGHGGIIRVYHKDGNALTQTNELFPCNISFDDGRNLRMDNFAFDPNTHTVSYDEYGSFSGVDSETKVIGRITWQLERSERESGCGSAEGVADALPEGDG